MSVEDPILALTYQGGPPAYELDWEMTGATARQLRELLGLSQDWAAAAAGVKRNSIATWERTNAPVKPDYAALLLALSGEASEIVFSLASDYREGAATGPLRTWHTDAAFRADTQSHYPAAWHRAICARITARLAETDMAALAPTLYLDTDQDGQQP